MNRDAWPEVFLYVCLAGLCVAAGGLHLLPQEVAGAALSNIVGLVLGRWIPVPKRKLVDR